MVATGTFQKPLDRQIDESIRLKFSTPSSIIMNSGSEWRGDAIPRAAFSAPGLESKRKKRQCAAQYMVTKQEEEERNKSLENTDSMKLFKKKSFSYFNSLNVCLKRCANTRKRLQKQIVSDFFILRTPFLSLWTDPSDVQISFG